MPQAPRIPAKPDPAATGSAAPAEGTRDPEGELNHFILEDRPRLYLLGTFDSGITVLRQQIRALNLAWALVESGKVSTTANQPAKIAVVGGGFAGLTFAAALLEKRVKAEITVFEEHDTLLPLQQGSDTRWLHPRIYDWPDEGSEADVAMLPLLNWTAARASDVVVQVLASWKRIIREHGRVTLFCNTRHLQISRERGKSRRSRIEWVGEPRTASDGTTSNGEGAAVGCAGLFDHVVLAVGFGIEEGQPSYWRNEELGQPNLHQRRRTHLVSGQGDGAMIDLLRIRVSQYRQDRILEELFAGEGALVDRLREIKSEVERCTGPTGLFERLDRLFGSTAAQTAATTNVLARLSRRLRRDTDAVLQLKVRDLAGLLEPETSRISFQNALLVYLLYRVGGFAPTTEDDATLAKRYAIPHELIIRRWGTKRMPQLQRTLSAPLFAVIKEKNADRASGFAMQKAEMLWPGGYFGFPGKTADMPSLTEDELRSVWRKEYLPGPTALAAASICGAVLGAIRNMRPGLRHVRVTLHRVLPLREDQLLQQACDYQGQGFDHNRPTAGRTFPARNAMIGLAYRCRRPARTVLGVSREALEKAMAELSLHDAAREMMPNISYILAMPVLQPEKSFLPPSPVAAVLYLDSQDKGFFLKETEIDGLASVAASAFAAVLGEEGRSLPGVRNIPFGRPRVETPPAEEIPPSVAGAIELLDATRAPTLNRAFALNFDYADPASMDPDNLVRKAPDAS